MRSKLRYMIFITVICLTVLTLSAMAVSGGIVRYLAPAATPFSDAVIRLLPEFEKETGIKVEVILLPFDQIFQKTILAASNKTGEYDLIQLERPFLPAYVEPGYLVSLNKYLPTSFIDDMFPVHRDFCTFNGELYAVPHSHDIRCLYYRTDLLEKAGLKEPPKNPKELLDYAIKLNDPQNGVYGMLVAGSSIPGVWVLSDFIEWMGGSILDKDGKPVVNSPEAVAGLQLFVDMLLKDKVLAPGTPNYKWNDTRHLFSKGNAAMVAEFNDIVPLLEDPEESVVSGKYGMAHLPGPTNNGGKLLAIPVGAKNIEDAAKLLQWIVGPRAQMEMCQVSGTLSPMKSIIDKLIAEGDKSLPVSNPKSSARWDFYKGIVETAYDLPRTSKEPDIEQVLQRALSSALAGTKTPKEALDSANNEITDLMGE
ncbi:MAG: sugar ABC transporter substrate-binding protein [Candidatus Atribacteria bacterium]|nr:sugar ABC transporter substrate-binding protein [Candidatus Atribacteria bacterium]